MNSESTPIYNPFRENAGLVADEELAARAQTGDRVALELLLTRHQSWIFNLALRMLRLHANAEDATQEILLKMLHALPGFRQGSKLTTWLYRIAVNHLLNVRKDKWSAADSICSFDQAAGGLRQVPDQEIPDPRSVPVPVELLVQETGTHCTIGTLLCLDGRQRLVFILGEIFQVSDQVGAEIVQITPANFRQILSRARRDLYQYLRGNCGLVNPEGHCKCSRKTSAYIQAGFVDPKNLVFTGNHLRSVRSLAGKRGDELHEAYMRVAADVYRDHPFYEPQEQARMLREVLASTSFATPS
jgi:RNA polymerase sigma factor (sigma-70 family)